MPEPEPTYALRVTLNHFEPAIWRRVLVSGEVHLGHLHEVLQCVMGWRNEHLYEFAIGKKRFGQRQSGLQDASNPIRATRSISLSDAVKLGRGRLMYIYDMGDYWVHEIVVEEMLTTDQPTPVLMCVGGELACPPEDVGGTIGYQEFLDALYDPSHEDHSHYADWIGGEFDWRVFDLAAVNAQLADLGRRWK